MFGPPNLGSFRRLRYNSGTIVVVIWYDDNCYGNAYIYTCIVTYAVGNNTVLLHYIVSPVNSICLKIKLNLTDLRERGATLKFIISPTPPIYNA